MRVKKARFLVGVVACIAAAFLVFGATLAFGAPLSQFVAANANLAATANGTPIEDPALFAIGPSSTRTVELGEAFEVFPEIHFEFDEIETRYINWTLEPETEWYDEILAVNPAQSTLEGEPIAVVPLKTGTVTLVATTSDGAYRATCEVTVTEPMDFDITLDGGDTFAKLEVGDSIGATPIFTPNEYNSPELAPKLICEVTDGGELVEVPGEPTQGPLRFTAKATGFAIINVYPEGWDPEDGKALVLQITAESSSATHLSIQTPHDSTAYVGETIYLTGDVEPAEKRITWTSSDESVALPLAVSSLTGEAIGIKAMKAGTATIEAKNGDRSDSCQITILQKPTSIELTPPTKSVKVGDTYTVTPTFHPTDTTEKGVTYASADPTVATVDGATGEVTAVGVGSTFITATSTADGSVTGQCRVLVSAKDVAVASVSLDHTNESLGVGDTLRIKPTVSPEGATNKLVSWESDDEAVVSIVGKEPGEKVTSLGEIQVCANKAGTATITATTVDGGRTATCEITVTQAIQTIHLSSQNATVAVGEDFEITATIGPDGADSSKVTWTTGSGTQDVISVVQPGESFRTALTNKALVTGKAPGSDRVIATSDTGVTGACSVWVTQPAASITLTNKSSGATIEDDGEVIVSLKDTFVVKGVVSPPDASDNIITWSSSNDAIAIVSWDHSADNEITILATGPGDAIITAEVHGVTVSFKVIVRGFVETISLTPPTMELKVKKKAVITPLVLPTTAEDRHVTWKSSAPEIIDVSHVGATSGPITVTTKDKTGVVTLTATTRGHTINGEDDHVSATCVINVTRDPVTLAIEQAESTIYLGTRETEEDFVDLSAYVEPADSIVEPVTWKTNNERVILEPLTGTLSGALLGTVRVWTNEARNDPGDAIITATTKSGVTKTAVVHVNRRAVDLKIELKMVANRAKAKTKKSTSAGGGWMVLDAPEKSETLKVGGTLQLASVVLPEDVSTKIVAWSSSDPKVASVSMPATGIEMSVVARKVGSTVITARTIDGSVDSNGDPLSDSFTIYVTAADSEETTPSPHGGYVTSTNKCSVCHSAHRASNVSGTGAVANNHITKIGGCETCHTTWGAGGAVTKIEWSQSYSGPHSDEGCTGCHEGAIHGNSTSKYAALNAYMLGSAADEAIDEAFAKGNINENIDGSSDTTTKNGPYWFRNGGSPVPTDGSMPQDVSAEEFGVAKATATGYMCMRCHKDSHLTSNAWGYSEEHEANGDILPMTSHSVSGFSRSGEPIDASCYPCHPGGLAGGYRADKDIQKNRSAAAYGCDQCHDMVGKSTNTTAFPHALQGIDVWEWKGSAEPEAKTLTANKGSGSTLWMYASSIGIAKPTEWDTDPADDADGTPDDAKTYGAAHRPVNWNMEFTVVDGSKDETTGRRASGDGVCLKCHISLDSASRKDAGGGSDAPMNPGTRYAHNFFVGKDGKLAVSELGKRVTESGTVKATWQDAFDHDSRLIYLYK